MSAETVLYKVKDTLNEHSSEILTGLGIAGFIGCACYRQGDAPDESRC